MKGFLSGCINDDIVIMVVKLYIVTCIRYKVSVLSVHFAWGREIKELIKIQQLISQSLLAALLDLDPEMFACLYCMLGCDTMAIQGKALSHQQLIRCWRKSTSLQCLQSGEKVSLLQVVSRAICSRSPQWVSGGSCIAGAFWTQWFPLPHHGASYCLSFIVLFIIYLYTIYYILICILPFYLYTIFITLLTFLFTVFIAPYSVGCILSLRVDISCFWTCTAENHNFVPCMMCILQKTINLLTLARAKVENCN